VRCVGPPFVYSRYFGIFVVHTIMYASNVDTP
jgi:hypothetical protein